MGTYYCTIRMGVIMDFFCMARDGQLRGGTGWSGTAVAGQEDFGTSAQEQEVQRRSDLQLIYQWIDQEQLGDGYPKIIDVTYFNSSEYCSRWMKKIVYIA